jgi:hypothetical protein
MVEVAFVTTPDQGPFFRALVCALRAELLSIDIRSVEIDGEFSEPRRDRVYVIGAPRKLEADVLEGDPALAARTIVLCPEPGHESLHELRRGGVTVEHLPLGFTNAWDLFDAAGERDIDVLFMGSRSLRRTRCLASYSRVLARRTCHLSIFDYSMMDREDSPSLVTEHDWTLLTRARILINLHLTEHPELEWLRALVAIHCGCVFVSEHSTSYAPLEPGRHFFAGAPEALGLLVDGLLNDEGRLRAVAQSAYELILGGPPMLGAALRLASLASQLAGGPAPRPLTPRPEAVGSLGAEDAQDFLPRALKDVSLQMVELRRGLDELWSTVESPDGQPPPRIRQIKRSSAWAESTGARVTIITAVFNEAKRITDTLDSIARGTFTDFEIVLIDDGSRDGSGQAGRDWICSHDHIAALLLEHPVNQGLGAARNAALNSARGEYCLIVDADSTIYPHCLHVLALHLDANPQLAFAYPFVELVGDPAYLLERFDGYLPDRFPWSPARLRELNYVGALAMIRTAVLRELGGYTIDRRLYGVEDHDLWCRVADSGRVGALVPQVLARARVSPSSTASRAEISLTTARAALAERSPNLFAGKRGDPLERVVPSTS